MTETYTPPAGSTAGNQYYQDVEVSPVTLKSGELAERLDTAKYPRLGTRSTVAPASVVLTVDDSAIDINQTVTLTCTVTAAAAPAPQGRVRFFNGAALLGEAPLRAANDRLATLASATTATATLKTKLPTQGTDSLTAEYGGTLVDTTSAAVSETVGATPAITSADAVAFTNGDAGSTFTVTATGVPTPAITHTGALPAGVTFTDNGDGTATLAGTPTANGSYPLTITAHNTVGPDAVQTLTVTVA